jgi:hypothetical protein
MKTSNENIKYANKNDYFSNRGKSKELLKESLVDKSKTTSIKDVMKDNASKELASEKAKEAVLDGSTEQVELTPESKDLDQNKKGLKEEVKALAEVGKESAKQLMKTPLPSLSNFVFGGDQKIKEKGGAVIYPEKQLSKPVDALVYFVGGFGFGGLFSNDGGVKEMSNFVKDAKYFAWSDEDKILGEISKTPKNVPLVMVGHSLGGDAVVSIAKKLNSLEYGYREVDLAVTLDSVGFDNDIIPPNVVKNLNFIGDKDMLFNDGPNIAFDNDRTEVVNELRRENHMDMDDANDVRFKIYKEIESLRQEDKSNNDLALLVESLVNSDGDRPKIVEASLIIKGK